MPNEPDGWGGRDCVLCGQKGRGRINVHIECIVHAHDQPFGPPRPRAQEEWATLYTENERLRAVLTAHGIDPDNDPIVPNRAP